MLAHLAHPTRYSKLHFEFELAVESIELDAAKAKIVELEVELKNATSNVATNNPLNFGGCPEFCVNGVLVKGCSSGLRTGW